MKQKQILIILLLLSITQTHTVFRETLEEFIVRMSKNKEEQNGFRAYYSNFLDNQSRLSTKRKRQKLRRLRKDGLASLKTKHDRLYKTLARYGEAELDAQSRPTRLFLVRYRLFEDYLQNKNTRRMHVWSKIKGMYASVKKRFVKIKDFVQQRYLTV